MYLSAQADDFAKFIVRNTQFKPGEYWFTLTNGDAKVGFTSPVPLSRENIASTVINAISQAVESNKTSFADYFEHSHGKSLQQAYGDYTRDVKNFGALFYSFYTGVDDRYPALALSPVGMGYTEFSHYLTDHATEISHAVDQAYQREDYLHPQLPENSSYVSITTLVKDLDFGEYGYKFDDYFYDEIPADEAISNAGEDADISWNRLDEWMANSDEGVETFEECMQEGIIPTQDFDYYQAVQFAQGQAIENDLRKHLPDLLEKCVYNILQMKGVYAISKDAEDALFDGMILDEDNLSYEDLKDIVCENLSTLCHLDDPDQLSDYVKNNPVNPVTLTVEGAHQLIDNPHLTPAQQAPSTRKGMSR